MRVKKLHLESRLFYEMDGVGHYIEKILGELNLPSFPPPPGFNHDIHISGARDHPNPLKKRSENAGANENLSGGFAAIPGIAPRVAPRIVGFVLIKS